MRRIVDRQMSKEIDLQSCLVEMKERERDGERMIREGGRGRYERDKERGQDSRSRYDRDSSHLGRSLNSRSQNRDRIRHRTETAQKPTTIPSSSSSSSEKHDLISMNLLPDKLPTKN